MTSVVVLFRSFHEKRSGVHMCLRVLYVGQMSYELVVERSVVSAVQRGTSWWVVRYRMVASRANVGELERCQ